MRISTPVGTFYARRTGKVTMQDGQIINVCNGDTIELTYSLNVDGDESFGEFVPAHLARKPKVLLNRKLLLV